MSASRIAAGVGILAALIVPGCGGDSPNGPEGPTLTGRWAGNGTYSETGSTCEGEAAIVLQLTQSGQALTGSLLGTITRASATCLTSPGQSLSGQLTGTATAAAVEFTVEGPVRFTGSIAGQTMSGTFVGRFLGIIDVNGRWTATRQ